MACIGRRQGVSAHIRSKRPLVTGAPDLKTALSELMAWLPACLIFTEIGQLLILSRLANLADRELA